jgi:hypothetical protein
VRSPRAFFVALTLFGAQDREDLFIKCMALRCKRVFHLRCCSRTPGIVVPDDHSEFECDRCC